MASLEEIAMQVREFLSATGLRMNPEYKKLLVNDTECRSDNLRIVHHSKFVKQQQYLMLRNTLEYV